MYTINKSRIFYVMVLKDKNGPDKRFSGFSKLFLGAYLTTAEYTKSVARGGRPTGAEFQIFWKRERVAGKIVFFSFSGGKKALSLALQERNI